jgi:2-oxoglutarate/2-oxoacid ferredoxin oxidoreductase subunit beta
MPTLDDYKADTPAWCPGCGNFIILRTFKEALAELGLEPHQFTIVSGIGQAAKFPHYVKCNAFNGLHGRSLPVATGLKLANSGQTVIAVTGDGDCYGEGGNHFIHAMRRNINIKLFVHDNQIYGLTKGQASPTTLEGTQKKNLPFGTLSEPLNPMALAVAMDCSFAARTTAGDTAHLKETVKAAILHKGFSLVDILQPCVTFNKINTYEWYKQRVYKLGPEHNPEDRSQAFNKALEWETGIPIGIIHKNSRPLFEEKIPFIKSNPLVRQGQKADVSKVESALKDFY